MGESIEVSDTNDTDTDNDNNNRPIILVLITQDWAINSSLRSTESRSPTGSEKGISWRISVVARKKQGNLQSQTMVHIVENWRHQDSSVVTQIIDHVLRTL